MGGSSKKVTVGYKYYVGMHMILTHGVADKLVRIRVDERDAFTGRNTGSSMYINQPGLFGGESREGGIQGTVDVEMGRGDQTPNSYLVSKLGSLVPAFRGVVGIVLRQVYMGLNPYLKNWDFRLQRIHRRYNDQLQWYDDKAEIPILSSYGYEALSVDWKLRGIPPVTGVNTYTWDAANSSPTSQTKVFNEGSGGTKRVTLRVQGTIELRTYTGSTPVNGTVVKGGSPGPTAGYNVYRLTISSPAATYYLNNGASSTSLTTVDETFEIDINDNATVTLAYDVEDGKMIDSYQELSVKVQAVGNYGSMNPAHIIRECLTDPDWGMGYQDADIDEASFIAAADRLFSEQMGMCILWDTQTSIEEFVKEIIKHIDAALFVDRSTGQFVLKLIRDDYDEDSLIVLDEENIDKITDFKRPTFGELINAVTVTYWNIDLGEDSTITVADIALAQQQGNNNLTSIKYQGFVTPDIASRVAQRDLKQLSTPLVSCTIYTNSYAESLNIGSVFKLNWPDFDVDHLVMRVTGIAYGDGKSNRIRITCAQDVFALPDVAFIPATPPAWEDPTAAPVPIIDQMAFEVPYLELVQVQGQTPVDNILASNSDAGYVGAAAARPNSSSIAARLFTDNGSGYQESGQVDFSPSCRLDGDIDRITQNITVKDAQDFNEILAGSWFQVDDEIMAYVGLVSPNVIEVKRGVLDTVPVEHADNSALVFWDYYAEADPTEYIASDVVNVKLCTVAGGGELALEDAPVSTVTLRSRAFRPYPPGDFKVNGAYFPDTLAGPVVLDWTTRNRVQQTTPDLVGFFDGPVTSEAGVTYNVRLRSIGGVLISEQTGISALTANVTVPGTGNYRLQLSSERDGYESFQIHDFPFFYSAALQRFAIPLTYDEQTGDGVTTLTRLGAAPWITPNGMLGDGYTARYRMNNADLPAFAKLGNIGPLTMHASVRAINGARNGTTTTSRDVVLSLCEDNATANPKLEIAVMNDNDSTEQCNLAVRSYSGGAVQVKRLARGSWSYGFRFPVLLDGANKVRPQACLFLDANTLLIVGHYNDTKSRAYRIDLATMGVTGQFDFPSPYVHIASAAFRASDSTYWFGDYATGRLLGVDLAASFTAGTAQITFNNLASAIVGFGSIDWVAISGVDYLLAVEYSTSGTRYVYVAPASAFTNGGTFAIANRTKRFNLGIQRMQGVCMEGGKMFVTMNKTTADTGTPGRIQRFDILTAIASTADGATLTAERSWYAPSQYAEDLDFHPTTGECWTSSEGRNSVVSDDGWLAYWHAALTNTEDSNIPENNVTLEYDGGTTVKIKINNQLFEEMAWSPTISPTVLAIGGPPAATAGVNAGFFVGTVRRIVIQDQAMTTTQYNDAIAGTADEPNSLTAYTVTITNPGAETGDTSGWTNEVGAIGVRGANPAPHNGSWYFTGGAVVQSIARQRFNIATVTGLSTTDIDTAAAAGNLWARVNWWQNNYDNTDPGSMGIRMLDGTPTQLSLTYSGLVAITQQGTSGANRFELRGLPVLVPSGARNIDAVIRNDRTSGTNNDAYFDDVTLTFYKK